MKNKYNIICFGFLPWSNMWKRNQSMMAELAKYEFIEKVIFVDPDISLRQVLKQAENGSPSGLKKALFSEEVHFNILKYTPFHLLPVSLQNKCTERIESRFHLNRLRQLNGDRPYILFMNCPNLRSPAPLESLLRGASLSVFDMSDDFMQLVHNRNGKELYARNINAYTRAADVVLTVNEYLKEKYSHTNSNIHVVKNATNYSNFDRSAFKAVPFLETLKKSGRPLIGYSGLCNVSRIDIKLLEFLLTKRPDWHFVFVGNKGDELQAHLSEYANLHILQAVAYEQLPDYLNYFHVAVVPFRINDHTRGNNLLKFHDYLSMGKPVVTTNIGGAKDLKEVVRIADTYSSFLNNIEAAMEESIPVLIQRRKQVALSNSWPNRVKQVEKILIENLNH